MKKRFLSALLAALMLLTLLPVTAFGADIVSIVYSDYCGGEGDGTNLTWTLDSARTLTISGEGKMGSYSNKNTPWYFLRSYINAVVINNGVTSICDIAFHNCTSLTSITVESGNQYYCNDSCGVLFNKDKTELIAYPAGNVRKSYTIPKGVMSIGDYAFVYCRRLTSITIPNSVTSIGYYAFYDCTNLTNITISNGVISIGDCAFEKCSKLTNITIPNGVTSIGDYAFFECSMLTSVTISNSVTSIGDGAFYGCTRLTDVYYNGSKEEWDEIAIGMADEPLAFIILHIVDPDDPAPSSGGDDSDDPTPPDDPAPSGGCYVATCVYGSYDCPEVWTLRRFRDETLAQTWYGRLFIRTYYAVSPTLVKWFGDTDWFKDMWRGPLDKMVQNLNAKGVPNTAYNDIDW